VTKYIKILLAAVTATVLMLALPVFSVSAFSTVLEVSSAILQKGNTAEITVSISNNSGIAAAGLKIHYDTSALVLVNAYYTDLFGNVVNTVNSLSSPVLFNFISGENLYENGALLKLEFAASENAVAGEYPVALELMGEEGYVVRYEADGSITDLPLSLHSGAVILKENMCAHESFTSEVRQKASCTEGGTLCLSCSDCGAFVGEEYIPPKGHIYSQWFLQKPPSYTEEGEETRTCTVCGAAETRKIRPLEKIETDTERSEQDTAPPLGDNSVYLFLFAFAAFAVILAVKSGKTKIR